MNAQYDVIVVGAGPAGSTVSRLLAQKNFSVILLDRAAFPRDKPCGDGLPPGAVNQLRDLGLFDEFLRLSPYPITQMRFQTPNGSWLNLSFTAKEKESAFFTLARRELDSFLLNKAIESRVEFRQAEVAAPIVENGYVCGVYLKQNGILRELRARIIIAADGSNSILSKSLLGCNRNGGSRFVAIRAYVEGLDLAAHSAEFFWLKNILPGYAWIFRINDSQINVGLGLPFSCFRTQRKSLRQLLEEFLSSSVLKKRAPLKIELQRPASWIINMAGASSRKRSMDGALFIGDAGYWVDPLSGEGMHNALHSARIAADVVLKALEKGDVSAAFLSNYDRQCQKEFGEVIHRSLLLRRWLKRAPFLFDLLAVAAAHFPIQFKNVFNRFSKDFNFTSNKQERS